MKTGADFIFVGSGAVELATRKANGMVRFCEGWCGARGCSNPSVLTAKRFGDKKGVDMQLKRNKATVCALPSIHLPLTREASVMAIFEGLLSFCNCCGNGSIRCNGRGKQGKDALACVPKCFARMQSQPSTHLHSSYEKRER